MYHTFHSLGCLSRLKHPHELEMDKQLSTGMKGSMDCNKCNFIFTIDIYRATISKS